jgi:ubiquinone/menaquinone biosynthesis C-methylase UbiE
MNADRKDYESETRRHYQEDRVAREYHEQFAAQPSLRNLSHVLVAKAEQRAVQRLLSRIRDDILTIADVPCGTGKLLPIFDSLALPAVCGDVSGAMIRIARDVAGASGGKVSFSRLDITRLPFRDGAFDAVVCLRLLHRVPPPIRQAALAELHRVSRRYVVISYGISSVWHTIRQWVRGIGGSPTTIPYPVSRREIKTLLREFGWTTDSRISPLPILSAEEIALLVKS